MRSKQKEYFRLCPICRRESFIVIPSTKYIKAGPEKDAIVEKYKDNLLNIPCKHFSRGEDTCPFGNSCFYSHINKYA
jgi:E3 ubiquitin-protein ligase makorin